MINAVTRRDNFGWVGGMVWNLWVVLCCFAIGLSAAPINFSIVRSVGSRWYLLATCYNVLLGNSGVSEYLVMSGAVLTANLLIGPVWQQVGDGGQEAEGKGWFGLL